MEEKIILYKYTIDGGSAWFLSEEASMSCHMHIGVGADPNEPPTSHRWLARSSCRNTIMRFHLFYFSIGFWLPPYQEYHKTAFWRTKMLIPLFAVTLLIANCLSLTYRSLLLLWQGWYWPLGNLIENPYMWSYDFGSIARYFDGLVRITRGRRFGQYQRQAMNAGLLLEALLREQSSVAILMHFILPMVHLAGTANLFLIMTYYTAS